MRTRCTYNEYCEEMRAYSFIPVSHDCWMMWRAHRIAKEKQNGTAQELVLMGALG